jgi:hypothetical protein
MGRRFRWVAGILLLISGIAAVAIILALPSSWFPWHEQRSELAGKVEGQSGPPLWSSGAIERVAPSPEFLAKLNQAVPSDRPALYATEGLWYDALDSLSGFIQVAPDDRSLRQHRASLLEQVGLHEAAAQDLRR